MTGLMAKIAAYSSLNGIPFKTSCRSMGIMPGAAQDLAVLAQANKVMTDRELFRSAFLSIDDIRFRKGDACQTEDEALAILDMRAPFVPEIREPLLCRVEDQLALEQRPLLNVKGLDRMDVKIIINAIKELRADFRAFQDVPGGIKISRLIAVRSRATVKVDALGSPKSSFEDARAVGITVAYNGQTIYSDPAIVRGRTSEPR